MPKTIFIGDLHLDKCFPKAVNLFVAYLDNLAVQEDIDALYIVGDLFEYWLGDDCSDATAKRIAHAIAKYHQNTNVPVYFTHGNRDFLLGVEYAKLAKFHILPEVYAINLYGMKTLILHGDTLCTDDAEYIRFRERVHNPDWQKKILRLPVFVRQWIAHYLRFRSKRANANKSQAIMDVAPNSLAELVREHNATHVIHGHTHRPALHEFEVDGKRVFRYVVGDWYTQGSVLEITPDGAELLTLPL